MKKILYVLIMFLLPIFCFAGGINFDQEDDKKKKKRGSTEIRAERKIALTLDGGWNTVGACGIMASYYVNPRVGIDLGAGIGFKGPKLGVRGKYMLSSKNFAPFVGLGISGRFFNSESQRFEDEDTGDVVVIDVKNVLYVQPAIGFEYMSNGGFVIGLATGYTIAANEPYEVISGNAPNLETGFDLLWGNGIILSLNIGYAF